MSTPGSGTRELRSRVSTAKTNGLNSPVSTARRQSTRKKVSTPNYVVEYSPSPLKTRLRKTDESTNQKSAKSENGENKRRKIEKDEKIDTENNNSMIDSSSQSISSELDAPSSSSSAFKSPNKKVGMRLRSAGQEKVKKLLKNAKGTIRDKTKRQSDANPGPSSSMRKSETVTPKSTKTKGPAKRKALNNSTCDSDNDNASKEEINLNSLEIPQCPLPCREPQFEQILNFVKNNVAEKSSGCIYVSGVPGTGKTAIVQSVIDTLKKVFMPAANTDSPIFKYVYINGLSLGSPDRIWKRFFHGLHHDKIKLSSATALNKLKSYFETKSRIPVVLVIDEAILSVEELDQVLDKQQSILYTLLEWAAHPSTMLSLVAIFNTMSLPENVFASRTSSRMSFARVVFPSYESSQLQAIVTKYLKERNSTKLSEDAIKLLSRKVAALSGDARRALEISKRAVEIVEEGNFTGIKAVDAAFKEIFSSPKIDTVKDCSMLEQLFLKTVSTEQQRTGMEETTLMTVQTNIVTRAPFEGLQWSPDQFLNAASKLVSMKLIVAENDSSSLHKKISLNIPVEDVNYALNIETNGTTNGHHD